ncbi:hypothetical protein QJQ45_015799 [Haematococcus lacustris]|nr:hypothetical protein QJQ45_015799 [Haematococcus lacustris]
MAGAAGPLEALPSCEPQRYLGGRRDTSLPDQAAIHPCGLIPSSLFNDSFSLHQTCDDAALSGHIPLQLDVAFRSELATALFSNPRNATNFNTVASLRGGGTLEGPVSQAPQLWVWSRVAAQPGLTKPFAVINTRLAKGCRLRLEVANRYNSYAWDGQKAVLLSTASWAASTRNLFLPVLYLVMAGGCGVSALGLVALGVVTRRRDKAIRWSCNSMSADTTAPAQSDKVKVAPSDVVLVGSGVLAAGALAGAVATYRRGSKSLVEDGINPDIRMRMIPIALDEVDAFPIHGVGACSSAMCIFANLESRSSDLSAVQGVTSHLLQPSRALAALAYSMTNRSACANCHFESGSKSGFEPKSDSSLESQSESQSQTAVTDSKVKTLMLSMAFTSMLGVAGFYGLKAAGLFSADVAELPSVREAAAMLRNPRAYIREQVQAEAQQRR